MKFVFYFMLCLCFSGSAYAQEMFIDTQSGDTCLLIGGVYLETEEVKVLQKGNIGFKKYSDLSWVTSLEGAEFTNQLFNQNLYFLLDGYEPFWSVKITKDKLNILIPVEDREHTYSIQWACNENSVSPGFFALFSSECGTIFGTINYIGFSFTNAQRICEYNIPEKEDSLYEVYISIQGNAYKGCATIEKYTEE